MHPDYVYFYTLRTVARERTAKAINKKLLKSGQIFSWDHLTLCSINNKSIEYAAEEWPKFYNDETHHGFAHTWGMLYQRYSPRPDHFDLAIWQTIGGVEILQGLALGNPSHGRTHLTIKWVERNFGPNYLKGGILIPVLTCAEEYAKLLGAQRVLIKDPVYPEVYERYGYAPYRHPNVAGCYFAKEV